MSRSDAWLREHRPVTATLTAAEHARLKALAAARAVTPHRLAGEVLRAFLAGEAAQAEAAP